MGEGDEGAGEGRVCEYGAGEEDCDGDGVEGGGGEGLVGGEEVLSLVV